MDGLTEAIEAMFGLVEDGIDAGMSLADLDKAMGGTGDTEIADLDCPICDTVLPFKTTGDLKAAFAHARAHNAEYDAA